MEFERNLSLNWIFPIMNVVAVRRVFCCFNSLSLYIVVILEAVDSVLAVSC